MNVKICKATITVAIIIGAAFGITSCATTLPDLIPAPSTAPAAPAASYNNNVVYEVNGTARSADLTMHTLTGTSQQSNVLVPVTNKTGGRGLTLSFPPGEFLYISAQNNGYSGNLTCKIYLNGTVISTNTSSGEFSIVTCSGTS